MFVFQDLQRIQDIQISIDESVKIVHLGNISSIVSAMTIVEALKGTLPIDELSVLFLEDRTPLGQVRDICDWFEQDGTFH